MYQIMLTIGSFVLLSFLTISVNNTITNRMDETYQAESVIASTTMSQALLQEISLKAFDEQTVSGTVDSVSGMTAVSSLGRDGEIFPNYDDIDDYKNYTRLDTVSNGIFQSTVNVWYCNSSTLDSSSVKTYYKKIAVSVIDSKKMVVPVTLSTIISY